LAERFPTYAEFEEFYTRPRNTLEDYLELHTLVEQVQTLETLPYFIYRLLRGAYVFVGSGLPGDSLHSLPTHGSQPG